MNEYCAVTSEHDYRDYRKNFVDFRLRRYSFTFDILSDIICPQSVPDWTILLVQHSCYHITMIIVSFSTFLF